MPSYKELYHTYCLMFDNVSNEDEVAALLEQYIKRDGTIADNRELIIEAAPYVSNIVQFANPELKGDPEFMLEVTLACTKADDVLICPLEHASPTLKSSHDFISRAVQINGYALEYVS